VDVGAVCGRRARDRGQPVGSGIGQRARSDARFSSPTANAARRRQTDEGRKLEESGLEDDEESRDQSPVLLGGIRLSGRRQVANFYGGRKGDRLWVSIGH